MIRTRICSIAFFAISFVMSGTRSYAQSWVQVGSAGFSAGTMQFPTIVINASGTPYLVYEDVANGYKATVMKYDGSAWVGVGIPGFTAATAIGYNWLAIDKSGTPYVAFTDYANGQKASVMKYDGSSWIFVGTAGFSSGIAEYPSIAIDTSGTPFVVYGDYDASGNATVMKFDGTSWVLVGSAGFSSYSGGKSPIVIDRSGKPYIAYAEGPAYGYKATVMKFDGTSWGVLGSHGFSAGVANNMSLALDTADVPYIGYMDASFPGGVVAKFDGSSWVNVGTPGISGVGLQTISLAIDARNTPYFAYQSSTTPSSPGVMQFNGSTWNSFPGLSGTSGGGNVSIAVGGSTPYLAFIDDNNSDKASVMRLEIARITGTDSVCTTAAVSLSDTSAGGSWSSSNTAVAIVSTAGVVTGVSGGTAIISYSIGGFVAADTVIVNSLPDVSSITGASTVCVDSVVTLTDITTGGTWGSSDATVATAGSTTGVVNGIMAGTAVISYSVTNSCGTTVKTRNITVDACLPTSAMTQAGLNSSINLFPSPAHGSFNIRVSSPQKENTVVTITNVLGKVIAKFTAATNEDVSVQFDAPAGMYFLTAVTKDNTESTKFITN